MSHYTTEDAIDMIITNVIKQIVIPKEIKNDILKELKTIHERKNEYSEEMKESILNQIKVLDKRIDSAFVAKLDGEITQDYWKTNNDKWTAERDKLYIQLNEINDLDKQFYEKTDMLLGFIENVYEYFKNGTPSQRRRILKIISEKFSFKNKEFNLMLKPVVNKQLV